MTDIEVVQRFYAALAAKDIVALFEVIDESFVLTQDERLPWGGRFVGHDGLVAFAAALSGAIDSQVTTEAMFEASGEVVQFGRTRGTVRANGAAFDIAEVHRWVVRDGKAVSAHYAIDTAAMLEALGG